MYLVISEPRGSTVLTPNIYMVLANPALCTRIFVIESQYSQLLWNRHTCVYITPHPNTGVLFICVLRRLVLCTIRIVCSSSPHTIMLCPVLIEIQFCRFKHYRRQYTAACALLWCGGPQAHVRPCVPCCLS